MTIRQAIGRLIGLKLIRWGMRLALGYAPEWVNLTCAPPPREKQVAPQPVPEQSAGGVLCPCDKCVLTRALTGHVFTQAPITGRN